MKKAFLSSVVFILLFSVFLIFSVFYLNITQMNELNLARTRNVTVVAYYLDDIRSDLLDYLQVSVNIGSNSTNTIINVTDTLPSPYTNPSSELSGYQSFITTMYSNQSNLVNSSNASVISLNTTTFSSTPYIQFVSSNSSLNLLYSYTNLSKNELIVNGSNYITNYTVTVNLNASCANSNCSGSTLAGGQLTVDSTTGGLWHLNEGTGTTVADSSDNGNTGTIYGTPLPTWSRGRFGAALNFTGIANFQYIDAGNSTSLNMPGSFTIEFWYNQNTPTMSGWFVNKGDSGSYTDANYEVWLGTTNYLYGGIGNGSSSIYVKSTQAMQASTWYHVAFTADGTNLNLYINGVLNNSTAESITPVTSIQQLLIGAKDDGGLFMRFNGTLDEVAIYSRAKSADEIYADANNFHWDWGPIAMNNNISVAWHFDEGSGTAAYDSSGNGNTLTLSGATWNSSGKAGYALSFNGSTAYSEASGSSSLDVNNFTIEAWVISHSNTQTSGGGCAKIIAKNKTAGVCGSTYPYAIQDDCTTNRIMAYIYTSSIYSVTGPLWSTFLGWTHVAMTYNGSNLTLYINGTLYNSTAASGTLCTNTMSLLIGGRTAQFFNGTLDEVAIYSRAKSAAEIAADAAPVFVSFDIRDSLNSSALIGGLKSGYVNPGANNTMSLKMANNAVLNMTAGAYSGFYSLRLYVNNTKANLVLQAIETGVSSIQAVIPVQLQIYQQIFNNLIIAGK